MSNQTQVLVAMTSVMGMRERSLYAAEVLKFVQANTSAGGKDIVVGAGRLVSTLCWDEQELPNGNSCFFLQVQKVIK